MSKNVVKEYVDFTTDSFLAISKKIMGKYFKKDLFLDYMKTYVSIRYYDQQEKVKSTMEANLNYYLGEIYSKDESNVSKFMLELMKMYYYLDGVKKFDFNSDFKPYVDEICEIRNDKVGIEEKEFAGEFRKMVRDMLDRRSKFIDSFDSNDFYLELVDVKENRYYVDIKTNVTIPRLFSGYAIRKVWNSEILSENTFQIELFLLSQVILRDIIQGKFSDQYLVDFRVSLFSKKEKLRRTIDIIRNDICLGVVSFSVTYHDFLKNRDFILDLIHTGIQFNVIVDDDFLRDKSYGTLDIFKYIIITDSRYKTGRIGGKKNLVIM